MLLNSISAQVKIYGPLPAYEAVVIQGRPPPRLICTKIFLRLPPLPPYLRVWMTGPHPYLKVWIRHCEVWYDREKKNQTEALGNQPTTIFKRGAKVDPEILERGILMLHRYHYFNVLQIK